MTAWLAALVALFGAQAACAQTASVSDYMGQPQVKADARIAYGPAPAQVVDLFLPKGPGPFPVVVLLHGGCFKAEFEGLAQTSGIAGDLARRGYAVWNVEYRKLGEAGAGYPGTFLDVGEAIDRLRAEAPSRKLDLTRVVALGHSAGGHLALWAASRPRLPRSSPLWRADPLPIGAVISIGGIGDLEAHEAVFAGSCGDALPRIIAGHYADTSPAELLPVRADVVMVHGEFDHVMPPETGRAYAETVRKSGGRARAVELKDAGHFDPVIPTTPAWRAVAELVAHELAELR
jgi:acetyl esterase/lipase